MTEADLSKINAIAQRMKTIKNYIGILDKEITNKSQLYITSGYGSISLRLEMLEILCDKFKQELKELENSFNDIVVYYGN